MDTQPPLPCAIAKFIEPRFLGCTVSSKTSTSAQCRPRDHLIAAGKLYPGAWKYADECRADRGDGLPDWPDWCYLPLAAAYAIVSGGGSNRVPLSLAGDVGRLGALMSWRVTQGIYRFDPALFERLIETPVSGDIPHEILYRLPEWAVYVETPGLRYRDSPLYGVFAHLEFDINHQRPELRLLLDAEIALEPFPLHLGPWSLEESIRRMTDVAKVQGLAVGASIPAGELVSEARPIIEPILSLLLYLCAENAEIGDGQARPANPTPKRTKSGPRLFAPDRPTTWDVGVRLGAALRRAYHASETAGDGTHAGPRPHVRRAHWHGFRSGAMKREDGSPIAAGDREFKLRWLPPIPVNQDDVSDLPATIRPVKGQ